MDTILSVDPDLKAVADFMQSQLPAGKLISVSDQIPKLARLLWGNYPQEPCRALFLTTPKMGPESPLPVASTE
jgi:hypothetical protein